MALVATAGLLTFSIGLSLIIARAALDAVFRVALWVTPSLSHPSQRSETLATTVRDVLDA